MANVKKDKACGIFMAPSTAGKMVAMITVDDVNVVDNKIIIPYNNIAIGARKVKVGNSTFEIAFSEREGKNVIINLR
jgi:hypothetical protein